jgi:2-amino-4-hydroxy-6-hydroxymethyldihydropteridine diphosphokinase
MPEVFIGAGSNLSPERRLRDALTELTRRFGPVRSSSVYRSPAVGVPAADYSNFVAAFTTELSVDALREELRAIEALAGRSRADPAVVELDLDLLLYGRRVDAERRLPRAGLFALPFTLVPLAELEPELEHPVTGESCRNALRERGGGALDNLGPLTSRG